MLKLKLQYWWSPDVKNWLIWKDLEAGKDWRWEEKGVTENEMVGWHHWLDRHEFEQISGVRINRESWHAYSPLGHKESDTTEWLNWTELKERWSESFFLLVSRKKQKKTEKKEKLKLYVSFTAKNWEPQKYNISLILIWENRSVKMWYGTQVLCIAGRFFSVSHQGCPKCGVPYTKWALLVAQTVKNLLAMQEIWVWSLGWDDSLEERAWQTTLVFLPGESPVNGILEG